MHHVINSPTEAGCDLRYAKRTDDNQAEIVKQLNDIPGCACYVLGDPLDLLIGFRGHNYLVEIKRPDKINQPSSRTKKQKKFIPNWPGQVRIASTFDEIYTLITESYK